MKKYLLLIALLLGMASTAQANLLTNGSFENGLTGWTASGNVIAYDPHPASDGTWTAVFSFGNVTPDGSLIQNIPTIVGERYRFSFDITSNGTAGNTQDLFTVILDGMTAVIENTVSSTPIVAGYTTYSYEFIAPNTELAVYFSDHTSVGSAFAADMHLDNVIVEQVPEPATFGLLGLGMAGLLLKRRKNRV